MNYAKGLRQSSGEALLSARTRHGPFQSIDDLVQRVPSLNRKELVVLARIGALNSRVMWNIAAMLFGRSSKPDVPSGHYFVKRQMKT